MKKNKKKNPIIFWIFFIQVIIWTFLFMCSPIWSNDIWWHLKTGEYILKHFKIPTKDIFTYTCSTHEWIDLHWIYQITQYIIFKISSFKGLILCKAFLITLSLIIILWTFISKKKVFLASFLMFISSFILNYRALVRPETYSYILFVIYLLILEAYANKQIKRYYLMYLLILLQIIWVNTQGIFVLGIILIFIYALDITLSLLKNFNKSQKRRVFFIWEIFVLSLISCLINPYFIKGALFPFVLYTRINGSIPVFKEIISEFFPIWKSHWYFPIILSFYFLAILSLILMLYDKSKIKIRYILLYSIFIFLAILSIRNITFFVFISLLIIQHTFPFDKKINIIKYRNISYVFCVFILILIYFLVTNKYYIYFKDARKFGIKGIDKNRYPINSVKFIIKNKLKGNIFHHLNDGGYLIWTLYPFKKVFIDTRLEVIKDRLLKDYIRMRKDLSFFKKIVKKYNIKIILLREQNFYEKIFNKNPNWVPIYYNKRESSLILLKKY